MTGDDRRPLQEQLDELAARVAQNADNIRDLVERAEASEAQAQLDREIMTTMRIDETLMREHVDQLERALRTSRTIGAAIGLVMARDGVDQDRALEILKASSSRNNVKLSVLSAEMVVSGRTQN